MVLGDSLGGYVVTYVDDLVVHSATFEDHLIHLDTVLQKLSTAGFTINATKCSFCKTQIKFLGHVINSEALLPDEDRVKAILSYPPPRNQKQLRRYLGVCNFHQQFIPNYAQFVAPLLILLKKGQKWKWNSDLQEAFETLRDRFAHSIKLVHPDSEADYIINTDASARAIGGVLMQEDRAGKLRIISTTSRVLSPTEQQYTTCEQELLAIVHALQRFRIYVYGRKIKLYTDSQALTFLNRCAITSNRVARWMLAIQQYDVEISHIKGTNNVLADVLSRNPSGLSQEETRELRRPDTIMVHAVNLKIDNSVCKDLKILGKLQDTDPRLKDLKDKITGNTNFAAAKFKLEGNILFCKRDNMVKWKAMVPSCLEQKVMEYTHAKLGHLGVDKCTSQIEQSLHLKNLGRKIRKFIACCDLCQRAKHPTQSYAIDERHHLPTKPGDLCAIDLYGSLPASRAGVKYILVCYDVFSKHVKLYPLKAATTKACLNKLVNRYFEDVIKPKVILSDNGSQFRSPSWGRKMAEYEVQVRFSPVRHPQSNPSERIMKELSKFCRIYCNQNHKNWAELLPKIEEWLNRTITSSTGYAPIELIFGAKRPDIFAELIPGLDLPEEEELGTKVLNAYAKMKEKGVKRDRRRKTGNSNWAPKLKDKVLVRIQPMSDAIQGTTAKFMLLYNGPFYISKVYPHSAYELIDEDGRSRGKFSKKALRPYREETA
jgi:ribonuclease HI